jgi:hypothetical protein
VPGRVFDRYQGAFSGFQPLKNSKQKGRFSMTKKQMPETVRGWTAWCHSIRELPREARSPLPAKSLSEKSASQAASHAG